MYNPSTFKEIIIWESLYFKPVPIPYQKIQQFLNGYGKSQKKELLTEWEKFKNDYLSELETRYLISKFPPISDPTVIAVFSWKTNPLEIKIKSKKHPPLLIVKADGSEDYIRSKLVYYCYSNNLMIPNHDFNFSKPGEITLIAHPKLPFDLHLWKEQKLKEIKAKARLNLFIKSIPTVQFSTVEELNFQFDLYNVA